MSPRVAVAVTTTVVVMGAALVCPPNAGAAAWRAPTDGRITRGFTFVRHEAFAPGRHRGADFAAARGAPVHAPCGGRVVVAARIGASGGVVTLACGEYRVSVLPLERITTHVGARVTSSTLVGAAGRSPAHDGVHLGVRRNGDEFGYVDPTRFIHPRQTLPPAVPVIGPRRTSLPRRSAAHPPLPSSNRVPHPAPGISPTARTADTRAELHAPTTAPHPLAPWPVWAGLGVLLLAATGSGARWRRRGVRTRGAATASWAALAHVARARNDVPP